MPTASSLMSWWRSWILWGLLPASLVVGFARATGTFAIPNHGRQAGCRTVPCVLTQEFSWSDCVDCHSLAAYGTQVMGHLPGSAATLSSWCLLLGTSCGSAIQRPSFNPPDNTMTSSNPLRWWACWTCMDLPSLPRRVRNLADTGKTLHHHSTTEHTDLHDSILLNKQQRCLNDETARKPQ